MLGGVTCGVTGHWCSSDFYKKEKNSCANKELEEKKITLVF